MPIATIYQFSMRDEFICVGGEQGIENRKNDAKSVISFFTIK
jgi:hypothetical protein